MKKYFLIAIIGILLIGTITTSCKKELIDNRDKYVGAWQFKETGKLLIYKNGAMIHDIAIDESGSILISKSGDKGLIIDGKLFIVNGNNLSSKPENKTETSNGTQTVGTLTCTGQLGDNMIIIDIVTTGTWSDSNGGLGTFSAKSKKTFTI